MSTTNSSSRQGRISAATGGQRNTGPTHTTGADRGGQRNTGPSGSWGSQRYTGPSGLWGSVKDTGGDRGGLASIPTGPPYSDGGGLRELIIGDPDAHMGSNTPAGRKAAAAADAGVRLAPDPSRRNQRETARRTRSPGKPAEQQWAETAGYRAETQIQQARGILARAIARQAGRSGGNTFSDRMGDRVLQKGFSSLSG